MISTPFTFVTTVSILIATIIILNLWLNKASYEMQYSPRFVMLVILAPLVRILFPLEFPFTHIVRSYSLYPTVYDFFVRYHYIGNGISVSIVQFLVFLWVVGSLISIILNVRTYCKYAACFRFLSHIEEPGINSILERYNKQCRSVRVVLSAAAEEPMIYGLLRPTIVLPKQSFTEDELCFIISHEIAHLLHGDLLIKWVLSFIVSVFWWLLPVHRLKLHVDTVMELKADQAVIANKTKEERADYLALLLKAYNQQPQVRYQRLSPIMFSIGSPKVITRRFNAITNGCSNNQYRKVKSLAITLLLSVSLLLPFGIVIQPYANRDNTVGTFELSEDSYLVLREDGLYDFYVGNQYLGYVTQIAEEMKHLPVIKN